MIWPITISTTDLVLLKGALKTIIPDFVHFSKSIWFVPIQNAPILKSLFEAFNTFDVNSVFDLIPRMDISLIFLINSS